MQPQKKRFFGNHVIAITYHFLLITFLIIEFHFFGFHMVKDSVVFFVIVNIWLMLLISLQHNSVIWLLSDIHLHLCVIHYEDLMMRDSEPEFWKSSDKSFHLHSLTKVLVAVYEESKTINSIGFPTSYVNHEASYWNWISYTKMNFMHWNTFSKVYLLLLPPLSI